MDSPSLFIAFPVDAHFHNRLKSVALPLFTLFTSGGEYLQTITHQGQLYLAKELPPFPSLDRLDCFESHLKSILKKLVPGSYSSDQCLLLSV